MTEIDSDDNPQLPCSATSGGQASPIMSLAKSPGMKSPGMKSPGMKSPGMKSPGLSLGYTETGGAYTGRPVTQALEVPISAVSKPSFGMKGSLRSIFQALHYWHAFASQFFVGILCVVFSGLVSTLNSNFCTAPSSKFAVFRIIPHNFRNSTKFG